MTRLAITLCAACVLTLLSGCATIINGSHQKVPISTEPSGATVVVNGEETHVTPVTLRLERKQDHVLVFEMNGYQTEQITLHKTISGAVAGNILAGGLIGWGVDAISGAQYKLVPDSVTLRMRAGSGGSSSFTDYTPPRTTPTAASQPPTYRNDTQRPLVTEEPVDPDSPEESRLALLDRLYAQRLITEQEYRESREDILRSIRERRD